MLDHIDEADTVYSLLIGLLAKVPVLEANVLEWRQPDSVVSELFLVDIEANQFIHYLCEDRRAERIPASDLDHTIKTCHHLMRKLVARRNEGNVLRVVDVVLCGSGAKSYVIMRKLGAQAKPQRFGVTHLFVISAP